MPPLLLLLLLRLLCPRTKLSPPPPLFVHASPAAATTAGGSVSIISLHDAFASPKTLIGSAGGRGVGEDTGGEESSGGGGVGRTEERVGEVLGVDRLRAASSSRARSARAVVA